MALSFDSNGGRIQTDILVCGYIDNAMKEYNIEIPDEIIGLCFLFWLIKICDDWDQSLCDMDYFDIDGPCAKLNSFKYCTLFGTRVVKTGIFNWRIKLNTKISWGCIGVIVNKEKEIENNKYNNRYGKEKECGCFLFIAGSSKGALFIAGEPLDIFYSDPPGDQGTVIEMILNMDKKTVQYKVNDQECDEREIGFLSSEIGYRFAVTVHSEGDEVELM